MKRLFILLTTTSMLLAVSCGKQTVAPPYKGPVYIQIEVIDADSGTGQSPVFVIPG